MKNTNMKPTKSPLKEAYSRRPGQSLGERIEELNTKLIMYLVLIGLAAIMSFTGWVYSIAEIPPPPLIYTGLFLIILVYCSAMIVQIRRRLKSMVLGREGEREVAEHLENLTRKGCYVFHDVPAEQNGNIDHVVVSQYGIFTIETKAFSNPSKEIRNATFNGQSIKLGDRQPDSDPVIQAVNEARWLKNKISHETEGKNFNVIPILVLLKWNIPQEQMKHADIWVLNQEWIVSSITQLKPSLSPDDIMLLVNVIRPLIKVSRNSA